MDFLRRAVQNRQCSEIILILPADMALQLDLRPRLDSNVYLFETVEDQIRFHELYSVDEGRPIVAQIGNWSQSKGLKWSQEAMAERRKNLESAELKVGTIISAPFIKTFENETAEGFVNDVLNALSDKYGLKVTYVYTFDGSYGQKVNGSWNGLVKMLLDRDVDMIGTGFAVTVQRIAG